MSDKHDIEYQLDVEAMEGRGVPPSPLVPIVIGLLIWWLIK